MATTDSDGGMTKTNTNTNTKCISCRVVPHHLHTSKRVTPSTPEARQMLLALDETALSKDSRGPTSTRRRFSEDSCPCLAVLAAHARAAQPNTEGEIGGGGEGGLSNTQL